MIPIVDFSPISSTSAATTKEEWKEVADSVFEAMSKFGFMYIVNHGVLPTRVSTVFEESENFFRLPSEIKDKYELDISKNYVGYTKAGKEILNRNNYELRETISTDDPGILMKIPEVPKLMPAMEELRRECQPLLRKLYIVMAKALELDDEDFFVKVHNQGNLHQTDHSLNRSMVKVNYYPAISEEINIPKNTTRLSQHTDYGSVTLLFNDSVGGLEVKTPNGWIPVTPLTGAVLVNIGDAVDMWTRGTFPANVHKVVIPEAEIRSRCSRMSVAYFIWPDQETLIQPLTSKVIPLRSVNGRKDEVILFREHGERRMNQGYTVQDKES